MKVTGYLKRYRMRILLLLLALVMMGVCIFYGFQTESVKAEKTEKQISLIELQTDIQKPMEEKNAESGTDKAEAVSQNKEAVNTNTDITSSESKKNVSKSASDKTVSGDEEKSKTPSVHTHNWKAVTKTREEKRRVSVYGDRCNTCNKNITGFAQSHILSGSCTGYSTDVIVSYDEVTEEIPYISYVCSCGAVKD